MNMLERIETESSTGYLRMKDALLLALSELVRKEVSADHLLKRIVDVMATELGADRATIFWLDATRGELISVAGHFPELKEIRVPLSQGVAGEVARTGRTINIIEDATEPRIWRSIDDSTGYHTRTMLAGPLFDAQGRVMGVVQFLNKRTGRFTPNDEEALAHLAKQAVWLLGETTLARQRSLDEDLELGACFNQIVGQSDAMRTVLKSVRRVASTEASVLLRGETGTGKTLVARALHHNSRRASGPFVAVDCTTLPEHLMENELFGHERGAYTGADRQALGKVDAAAGGTLFFDEIGDLPLAMQGKLLTLLQERTYRRVGGTALQNADLRVVAATNRNLEERVNQGSFREDLYYRLRVVELEIPPLRDRGHEDLRVLIEHFLEKSARRHNRPVQGISSAALEVLLAQSWPGNVRELENCVEAAVIFAEGHMLEVRDVRVPVRNTPVAQTPFQDEPTLAELEARYIQWLLKRHGGNRTECAKILGIGRNTLIRKLSEGSAEGG